MLRCFFSHVSEYKISKDFAAVGKDIRDLEEDLQGNLNKWILAGGGSDKGSSLPLTAADVGGAVFIFLDSSWGVLGPDGKLRRMTKSDDSHPSNDFEIQIPEHVNLLSSDVFFVRLCLCLFLVILLGMAATFK